MPLYKYVGTTEALLSSHDLMVKPGDIIETETPIENANFERIDSEPHEVEIEE